MSLFDASIDPPVDQEMDTVEDTVEIDSPIVELGPDAPPNITIVAPTSGEVLPATGSYTFKADVAMPGSGVLFRWTYMDVSCGGVRCNPCQQAATLTGGSHYEKPMLVGGSGSPDLCAGKSLATHHHGTWTFEVQVGIDKVNETFTVP